MVRVEVRGRCLGEGHGSVRLVPLFDEHGDLGGVVGEHSPAAPRARPVDAVEHGPFPAPGVLEVRDPPFGSGAPLDELAEAARRLDCLALRTGPSLPRDGDVFHAEGLELGLHLGFAIAAIGGHGFGHLAEQRLDAARWPAPSMGASGGLPISTLWSTHDAVDVVGHLCLVAELDRLAETTLADGPGIGVVEGHDAASRRRGPRRRGGCGSGPRSGRAPTMVRSSSATSAVALPEAPVAGPAKAPPGICGHDLGVFDGGLGDGGQLAGRGRAPRLWPRRCVGAARRRSDGRGGAPSGCGPESGSAGPDRAPGCAPTVLVSLATPLASRPESVG